jgi:glycosyltransferase involved in cell wall biosynthesis
MHIIIHCDSIPFGMRSLETHPLGGTESSVISLSRELALLGHQVTVVAKCPTYEFADGVEVIPAASVDMKRLSGDVFVSVRDAGAVLAIDRSNFGKVVFWSHDVMQHPASEHLLNDTGGAVSERIDAIVLVSDFVQSQLRIQRQPHLRDKLHVIRNGVDDRFLVERPEGDGLLHCTYHSMPYRGLVYLLDAWQAIQAAVPEARLHLRTGNQIYGGGDAENQWLWNRAKRVGAELHGPVCQRDLMASLAGMDLHLYPTDFVESSCTATMMSLASGCAVVATDLGALNEQVDGTNGKLIDGHPGTKGYAQEFVATTVSILADRARLRAMQDKARTSMAGQTWKRRAQQWVAMIEGL